MSLVEGHSFARLQRPLLDRRGFRSWLVRHVDGIAKAVCRPGQKRALMGRFSKSTSIVAETIGARERGNFLVDSKTRIFDGPASGI
jgi:hypothetical protein